MSLWHTTCTAFRDRREPAWDDVYHYRAPLRVLLASRYRNVDAADREDLVEDILLELKSELFSRHLPDRGPFRNFLCGVVRHRVLAFLKRRRKQRLSPDLEDVPWRSDRDLRAGLEVIFGGAE